MHKGHFYILGGKANGKTYIHEEGSQYGKIRKPGFISLFSGAMGLDLGLENAGFRTMGCLEIDKWACATIRANRPNLPLIEGDIRDWTGSSLLQHFGANSEDVHLVVGGPPCPSFSTAGKRQSFNDPRGQVMYDFLRIVEEIRPAFFVMENVRGILSASLQHCSLEERKTRRSFDMEEKHGSVLRALDKRFNKMGYTVSAELVNSANYGTPQVRERVVFLGSRDGFQVTMPVGSYSKSEGLFQKPWRTLRDALEGLDEEKPEYIPFSKSRLRFLELLNEGQNWRHLPSDLVEEAMGGAYESDGGKVGFYRRLSFCKPCPTVPTSPIQKSTCICHPTQLRPLSIREYSRVQQFPDDWIFAGPISSKYKQIGNAVPVGLGFTIGKTLLRYLDRYMES